MARSDQTKSAALTLIIALIVMITSVAAHAASYTFSGSGGTYSGTDYAPPAGDVRSAKAVFDNSGGELDLTLTNTATWTAESPTDILTAIVFNFACDPTLTAVSANITTGSTIVGDLPNPDTDPGSTGVGGEWALAPTTDTPNLATNAYGASDGVSSTGLNLFGAANFPGANLQGPSSSVDGPQYGIAPAGGVDPNGSAVKSGGGAAFIQNAVIFDLGGYTGTLDSSVISNITFIYGTGIGEAQIGTTRTLPVPEPPFVQTAVLLLLGGLYAFRLRRGRKQFPPQGGLALA